MASMSVTKSLTFKFKAFALNTVFKATSACNLAGSQCNFMSKREYLSEAYLRLDSHKERVRKKQERFGPAAEQFKAQFIEKLNDKATNLLLDDYASFIYLATGRNDTKHFPRVLQKYLKQLQEVSDLGFGDKIFQLSPLMLRQCHTYQDRKTAAKVFAISQDKEKSLASVATLMDLLFENGKYKQCAAVAESACNDGYTDIGWLYTMGGLSSYRMQSTEGLKTCAKFLDLRRKSNQAAFESGKTHNHMGYEEYPLEQLLILYCIEQGHYNAAFALLENKSTKINSGLYKNNLKMLAYLKAGRPDIAHRIMGGILYYHNSGKDAAEGTEAASQAKIVLKDVYELLHESADEQSKKKLNYMWANRNEMIRYGTVQECILWFFRGFTEKVDKTDTVDETPVVDPQQSPDYELEMSGGYYVDSTATDDSSTSEGSSGDTKADVDDASSSDSSDDSDGETTENSALSSSEEAKVTEDTKEAEAVTAKEGSSV